MSSFSLALLFGVVAALANLVGGLIVVKKEWSSRFLRSFVALGAGFMLAAAVLEMIPESIKLTEFAPFFILIGYMAVNFMEHAHSQHVDVDESEHSGIMFHSSVGTFAFVGLLLHSFFDGVAIGSSFMISTSLGVIIFIAMAVHKIPAGFTVASILMASGKSKQTALLAALSLGIATIVGVFGISLVSSFVAYGLALSAGVTIHVVASDLIPEINQHRDLKTASVIFLGILFFFITELLLEALLT
jgi:zinc and cadmium transporter